jgi:hypothetical protein
MASIGPTDRDDERLAVCGKGRGATVRQRMAAAQGRVVPIVSPGTLI